MMCFKGTTNIVLDLGSGATVACRKNKTMSLALSNDEQVGLDSFNGNMQIPVYFYK